MSLSAVAKVIDGSQLQLQARHYSSDEDLKGPGLGHVTSCVQTQSAQGGDAMSGGKNTQTLRERLRDALKRRVGKGRALTVKQVARDLSPSLTERTIENLMSGNNEPRSETLLTLMEYFDQSFADEVYAGRNFRIVKLSDQRAVAAAQQIIDGHQALKALDGA